ncbi:hypothetical protein OPT61_g2843 [Boeremia exigua]|uniref:Uncharacterized protein n=1 Tax=Boeremia exigua TaxID=749465 RepID=A0ACC2IJZ8_9PLEO|nr:hypothetical protein OPT61_g2843 [Boeremia exigua]
MSLPQLIPSSTGDCQLLHTISLAEYRPVMALPPGVRYYILRNNVEIPLVPIDQLPFQLNGLSQGLESIRYSQEGWHLVGKTQYLASQLSIRAPSDVQSRQPVSPKKTACLPPDHDARKYTAMTRSAPLHSRDETVASITFTKQAVAQSKDTACKEPKLPQTKETTSKQLVQGHFPTNRVTYPSGIEPDPSKKQYCTHWIRHNSCDYLQQGCRYKHEMPDREKLKELGFPKTPDWYRNKMAISAGASSWLRPQVDHVDNERHLSTEPPTSLSFRPPTASHRGRQSCITKISGSSDIKLNEGFVPTPDLIDLDDLPFETQSMTHQPANASVSDEASIYEDIVATHPMEPLPDPPASSLTKRSVGPTINLDTPSANSVSSSRGDLHTKPINSVLYQHEKIPTSKMANPKPKPMGNGVAEARDDSQYASKVSVRSGHVQGTRSSQSHGKYGSRSWRPIARSAIVDTRVGMVGPQHAPSGEPTSAHSMSKVTAPYNTSRSKNDLQSQIGRNQRNNFKAAITIKN